MPNYLRAIRQARADGDLGQPGDPITFTASTAGVKRDGLDINQNLWHLDNYRANPVFLWGHDYMGARLPIGRAEVEVADGRLTANVQFDQQDEFARAVESKYRRGFLHTVSVGWDDVRLEGQLRHDLLDISGVPVPGDPDALIERQRVALRSLQRGIDQVLDAEGNDEEAVELEAAVVEAEPVTLNVNLNIDEIATAVSQRVLAQLAAEGAVGGRAADEPHIRAGAALSKRNADDLQQAVQLIAGVLERAQGGDERQNSELDTAAAAAPGGDGGQREHGEDDGGLDWLANLAEEINKVAQQRGQGS